MMMLANGRITVMSNMTCCLYFHDRRTFRFSGNLCEIGNPCAALSKQYRVVSVLACLLLVQESVQNGGYNKDVSKQ